MNVLKVSAVFVVLFGLASCKPLADAEADAKAEAKADADPEPVAIIHRQRFAPPHDLLASPSHHIPIVPHAVVTSSRHGLGHPSLSSHHEIGHHSVSSSSHHGVGHHPLASPHHHGVGHHALVAPHHHNNRITSLSSSSHYEVGHHALPSPHHSNRHHSLSSSNYDVGHHHALPIPHHADRHNSLSSSHRGIGHPSHNIGRPSSLSSHRQVYEPHSRNIVKHHGSHAPSYTHDTNRIDSSRYHHSDHQRKTYPKYEFGYGVNDAYSGVNFGHSERRDGHLTTGKYHVLLPDGRLQKVSYYVDEHGYHPTITYERVAHYD